MYESFITPPADLPAAGPAPGGTGNAMDRALQAEGVSGELASLARSIYQQESGSGANTKTSNANAQGGMQIIPRTFASVADKGWDIKNEDHNTQAGVRYLKQLYQQSGSNASLAAAGYYGGPLGMQKARDGISVSDPRNPNAPNTLQYASQVVARMGTGFGMGDGEAPAQAPAPAAAPEPFYRPEVGRYTSLITPPVPSATIGDYAKELGSSAIDSIGSIGQFAGEGLSAIANKVSGTQDYVSKNLLKPASTGLRDTMTEGGKLAGQQANIEGSVLDLFTGDVELPGTAGGWIMLGMNGLGSMLPMLVPGMALASKAGGAAKLAQEAAVLAKASGLASDATKAAQLAQAASSASMTGKVMGGALEASMTGGAAAGDVRETTAKALAGQSHDTLMAGVPVYAEIFRQTGDESQARQGVINSAARWAGGLAGVAGAVGGAFNAKVLEDFFVNKGVSSIIGNTTASRLGRGAISAAGLGLAEGLQEVS